MVQDQWKANGATQQNTAEAKVAHPVQFAAFKKEHNNCIILQNDKGNLSTKRKSSLFSWR